jgi:hypothetical protein
MSIKYGILVQYDVWYMQHSITGATASEADVPLNPQTNNQTVQFETFVLTLTGHIKWANYTTLPHNNGN